MSSKSRKQKLKVILSGDRNCTDYEVLVQAIQESEFVIGEIVEGGARGVDAMARKYAEDNNIPYTTFEADWDNIDHPEAKIRTRYNKWKKCDEEYNYMAGFQRNQEMADYADALIAIQPTSITPGTNDMIERATKAGLQVYVFGVKKDDKKYQYHF